MIEDTAGITYIAMDYENLNYVIKLLEDGKFDKKEIANLKKISKYWRKQNFKKDRVISEKNKQIKQYIEIRVEQDKIISALEKNLEDMTQNYEDCEEKNKNKDKIIENKDTVIKKKNKTIVGMVIGYVIIGGLVVLSLL
jgi:hypothetical protein